MTTSQPMAFDAEKENLVLDAVERFVEREIKPVAQRLEHADPKDLIAAMRSHEADVMRLLGEIEALVAEVQA